MRGGTSPGFSLIALAVVVAWAQPVRSQPQAIESLMAVDAVGQELGLVVRVDYGLRRMQVAMEVEGELALIHVLPDSFSHGTRPVVYYGSRSCVGGAYMSAQAGREAFGGDVAVAGPRGTLYRGFGEPRLITVRSVQQGDDCVELGSPQVEVLDALPVVDLADRFMPPYSLRPIERTEDGQEPAPPRPPRPGTRSARVR